MRSTRRQAAVLRRALDVRRGPVAAPFRISVVERQELLIAVEVGLIGGG